MDNTGRFTSPLSGTVRTVSRPGDRWGFRLDYENLTAFDRSRIEAFIAKLRGAANRALFSPVDFPQRGSFPSQELFTNNRFLNGTNGWLNGGGGTMTVTDRRLRYTFNGAANPYLRQIISFAANQPYVGRYFLVDGQGGPLGSSAMYCYIEGSNVTPRVVAAEGLNTVSAVLDNGSGSQYLTYPVSGAGAVPTGQVAGNYLEAVWTSFSQCFLVDNGPNLLQFSDTLASPWATHNSSVTANATTAADGTNTAAAINDTTSNSSHYVSQDLVVPAAQADYMVCGEFQAGAKGFAFVNITENSGGTSISQFINLSTGALNVVSAGANWANGRSFVVPMGNGWYYFCLIGYKTNAATSISVLAGAATSLGTSTYVGTGAAAIYTRRLTASPSSVPAQQVQSAGAAVAATAQTGSALNVKGLPLSTQGLLLPGTWFEVNKELKRCTSQLDSDAAGTGYLQFSPPLRNSPNDNDPVIVNNPFGRFILASNQNGWQATPGPNAQPFGTLSLDLVEASG